MVAQSVSSELDYVNFPPSVDNYHDDFVNHGLAVIPDFLSQWAVNRIIEQTINLLPEAYHSKLVGNAYLSALDKSLPADHPYNMSEKTSLSTIAFDEIPYAHLLREVYQSETVKQMVAAIVGENELHFYACPMGAINIAVMRDGDYLRWHFDQCDFVVSIPIQDPIGGGHYQYAKDVRASDNPNYDGVRHVLTGQHPGITELKASPGSLIVFRGRNTIHRVTKIEGDRPRLVALLAYATTPDCDSSDHLKMIRYGRTHVKSPA
ncbi:MAG TPA: hypothetical protein VEL47_03780 [Myxococcota bacterium]|nr:hypothetical protein [Myxococcota bacterium]